MEKAALPAYWVVSQLAEEWGVDRKQIAYAIVSRKIEPSAQVGTAYVYDAATKRRIAHELLKMGKIPAHIIREIFTHEEVAALVSQDTADFLFFRGRHAGPNYIFVHSYDRYQFFAEDLGGNREEWHRILEIANQWYARWNNRDLRADPAEHTRMRDDAYTALVAEQGQMIADWVFERGKYAPTFTNDRGISVDERGHPIDAVQEMAQDVPSYAQKP